MCYWAKTKTNPIVMVYGMTKRRRLIAKSSRMRTEQKNEVVLVALIVSIVFTNFFVIFSPDVNARFYNAGLTSTVTIGVALVIYLIQVYRYKRRVQISASVELDAKQSPSYYRDDKIHFSICLFLGLWLVAQFVWTFPYQQTAVTVILHVIPSTVN